MRDLSEEGEGDSSSDSSVGGVGDVGGVGGVGDVGGVGGVGGVGDSLVHFSRVIRRRLRAVWASLMQASL